MIEKDVRTPQESFVDKLGREVRVGDTIAYGHALGRSAALRIGRVRKIEKVRRAYRPTAEDEWSIGVLGIEDGWYGEPDDTRLCKPGTLLFPDRTIKLDGPLPEKYTKHLETV